MSTSTSNSFLLVVECDVIQDGLDGKKEKCAILPSLTLALNVRYRDHYVLTGHFLSSIHVGTNNGDGGGSQPVLQFHNTRGEHVRLSADRSLARRVDSFCKGIAFSQRTVRPNEKVCRHAKLSTAPGPIEIRKEKEMKS